MNLMLNEAFFSMQIHLGLYYSLLFFILLTWWYHLLEYCQSGVHVILDLLTLLRIQWLSLKKAILLLHGFFTPNRHLLHS
ncbi:unnamed protein product [Musa acuminata subsp. burmannicoides]